MTDSDAVKKAITNRVAERLRQKGVSEVFPLSDVLSEVAREFGVKAPEGPADFLGGGSVVFSYIEQDRELFEPAGLGAAYRLKPEENPPTIEITYTEE